MEIPPRSFLDIESGATVSDKRWVNARCFQRSQRCAQVCHLQATVTCRQQNRGSRRTGISGGQTGVRCLYFPCRGLWLLWTLCHTTISNSSNSNAEGGEWETESSYFGIRVRERKID